MINKSNRLLIRNPSQCWAKHKLKLCTLVSGQLKYHCRDWRSAVDSWLLTNRGQDRSLFSVPETNLLAASGVALDAPATGLRFILLVKKGIGCERPASHRFQLHFTMLDDSSTSVILFDFPSEYADWHHEKKRREEDGEEHEQVYLRQVLSEVDQAFCAGLTSAHKHHIKPSEKRIHFFSKENKHAYRLKWSKYTD